MKTLRILTALGLIGALALTAASCGKTINPGPEEETTKTFSFDIVKATANDFTRAYDATWTEADVIGIFAVADGEIIEEVPYKLSHPNGDFVPLEEGNILSGKYKKSLELYAYYPYDAGEGYDTGTIGTEFVIQNDLVSQQVVNSLELTNPCDLMRGVGPIFTADSPAQPGEVPHFIFKHVLSNVTVRIVEDPADPKTGTVPFLPETAKISLMSGYMGSGESAGTEPYYSFIEGCSYDIITGQLMYEEYRSWEASREVLAYIDSNTGANILPETTFILCPGDLLREIHIVSSGESISDYNYSPLGDPLTLEGGKKYVITMYVNSSNMTVTTDVAEATGEIEDWTTENLN